MKPKKESLGMKYGGGQGHITVYAPNDVYAGVIVMMEDGYYSFIPEFRGGYWPSWSMRDIADKVDSMNIEWDAVVKNELSILSSKRSECAI